MTRAESSLTRGTTPLFSGTLSAASCPGRSPGRGSLLAVRARVRVAGRARPIGEQDLPRPVLDLARSGLVAVGDRDPAGRRLAAVAGKEDLALRRQAGRQDLDAFEDRVPAVPPVDALELRAIERRSVRGVDDPVAVAAFREHD